MLRPSGGRSCAVLKIAAIAERKARFRMPPEKSAEGTLTSFFYNDLQSTFDTMQGIGEWTLTIS
jgi:hypothetical protein